MKNKLLLLGAILVFGFAGCASFTKFVQDNGAIITPSFDFAVSQLLSYAKGDDVDEQKKLDMAYYSAQILRSLTGGEITEETLNEVLQKYLPAKAHWSEYADEVTKILKPLLAKLPPDAKASFEFTEKAALGIEKAVGEAKEK